MTRGVFRAALNGLCVAAGLCLTAAGGAAQPSDTPRSPAASLSANSENAAAAGNSARTVPQRLRTTILTNGAGRTFIVLGRGEGKR